MFSVLKLYDNIQCIMYVRGHCLIGSGDLTCFSLNDKQFCSFSSFEPILVAWKHREMTQTLQTCGLQQSSLQCQHVAFLVEKQSFAVNSNYNNSMIDEFFLRWWRFTPFDYDISQSSNWLKNTGILDRQEIYSEIPTTKTAEELKKKVLSCSSWENQIMVILQYHE